MKGDIIQNGEVLYRYVSPKTFPPDQVGIPIGIFLGDREMSFDWQKFQKNPERSYHIKEGKNIIIKTNVCDEIRNPSNPKRPRQIMTEWHQEILHDPKKNGDDPLHPNVSNLSHSIIKGIKNQAIAKILAENSLKHKSVNPDEIFPEEILELIKIPFGTIVMISVFVLIIILLIAMFLGM